MNHLKHYLPKVLISGFLTIITLLFSTALSAQDTKAIFEGKIVVGDDLSAPDEGAIRYNSIAKIFEGYNGTAWIPFSVASGDPFCSCTYIIDTLPDAVSYFGYDFGSGGTLVFTLHFSHKLDPSSLNYGTNVIISGTTGTSTSGTLTLQNQGTKLVVETIEKWSSISNCGTQFSLTLKGTNGSPILGLNGKEIDGDRDGCCGGDYSISFLMRC